MLSRISVLEKEEVTGGWRKLRNEFGNLYSGKYRKDDQIKDDYMSKTTVHVKYDKLIQSFGRKT
jgi:hypothetical protein